MLKGPVRVVPHWKELQEQLLEKLELQKGPAEAAETLPILLSDRASILFRESSYPSAMPLICSYLADSGAYFASFTWKRSKESKVRVWMFNLEEESSVAEKECSLEEDPRVLLIAHVPCWHLFVAYCEDIHLRFLGDHTQDFKLLSEMISPFSITSMCYSPETGEIVTGAIGMLAFWSFVPGEVPYISVTHKISIENGEFVHFLAVEQERSVLVALCENVIRVYNYLTKAQTQTFQVSQGVSLTCCTVSWIQSTFYTGDLVGDVKVWNFDTGSQMTQFKAHQSAISSIISRSSTHTLMTASLDGMLKEWNLLTCEQLRRVDIGEELFQMQFINDQTFFLRTRYTFSIRTVNNFYQLFNRTKSKLKKLVRIQCRVDKARILARTEDGVIRFLSPVTGEMLFVTWPFQALEKALDYVYDPDREELLVTTGTADIYVLDTTRNPCPIKYILRAADTEDKVLCLAYTCLDLAGRTLSFIFSGYKSGKVRTLTQHLYRMRSRKLHDGNVVALTSISASGHQSYRSRESSYLCSYGLDEYIILSDVFLKKNGLLEVLPLVIIPSTHCRINHLLLIPGYICVLTDQNRVRLWRQAALVPGQKNPFWQETDVMHSTTITSFDYCHALNMLVTGGSDGSVRLWDILGQLLVEFDTSLRFSQVCFANQWGDLVVGCNMDIYFISCVTYLPNKYLSALAGRRMREDVVERPLPFLPNFLLTFDIVFVPKYRQVGKQAMKYERLEPISNHKEVVLEKNIDARPEFAVEYQDLPQEKMHVPAEPPLAPPPYRGLPALEHDLPLLQRIHFQAGRLWPIAPDGYVPNSVIRAQLFPKGTPKALQCSLLSLRQPLPKRKMVRIQLPEWDETEVIEKAWKKKATRSRHAPPSVEGQRRRDLLAEIVSKPWLRHKPSEISLSSVLNTILNLMDDVPYSTYLLCTTTLVQLSESYALPPELKRAAFMRLMQDTKHKEVSEDLGEELGKSVQFAALQRASPEDKKEHVPATVGMPGTPGPPGTPTTHATQATQATHATQDMPTAHTTHAMPAKPKQDGSPLQAKVGELEHLQLPPPEPPSSLIDPKQRYSPDKSKWRSDLYKLMMLRIAPAVEGRTVTQDLLASAKCALSGRSMSWEAFASAAFPLVSSPEEITAETAKWQKYVEDLLRSPSWLSASEESLESVLAVKGRDSESDLERGDASQEKAGRGQGEAAEETEAPTEKKAEGKASKEPRTALRKKARKMTDREGKAAERLAKAGAEKEAETSREKVRGLLPKDREQEVSREKLPAFLPKAKEQEGVKGKESSETAARAARQREAAKGREAELAKGREREPEAAPPRREPPRGFQAREHGPARARELDAVQRKDREAARRRAEEPKEKRAEEEGKEPARGSDGEARARAKATKALLTDSDQQVPTATESVLAEMRAEAKERMLAELKDRAMAEAQRIALSEVKEKALAEARLLALSEARERALIKARKRAIAEQWEKILAEARKSAQQEVMELALAKAREAAYAEGGQVSEERIWELARAQAAEMAEARAKEIALAAAIEVDEQRVLELAEAEGLDLDEARVLELAEARAQALAEERTQALAEERFLELAEERKKQLLVDEEGQGTGESQDLLYEEEGMWEDLREESFSFLSEEEKEALLFAMWQEEEQAAEEELDLSAQAQLLLDILTKPEKLQASDSTNFQRLFQAATLLQAPPTADAEGLAETLLKKAEEILEEGKEQAGSASVWQELREALEARQPWHTDPSEFAGKMRDLQKTALTMLRARNLKQQLQREAMKKAWWEKAEKEWVEDEGRIKGKRDWLGKRFREAFGKWQAQQEKSERERLELKRHQKRLQFRARPIVLAISRRDRDRERKKESEQEQAAAAAAAAAAEELAAEEETAARLARQRQRKLTWSLAVRRDRAWKSIVQLEEEEQPQAQPQASERLPQLSRPKSYRLPKDSLYKTTKAAVRVHRKKLRRKGRQHIFHLDEDREVDWEKFTKLYQSLLSLKMVEGGVGSLAWQEKSSRLLDIYGMSNPLIRAMIRQALMGDHRQRKYVRGVPLRLRKAQANLGERILSEIIHHGTCQQHGPPALHGVIPLSYQNNVQTFQIQGVARFGALSLSWKAFCTRGKLPREGDSARAQKHSLAPSAAKEGELRIPSCSSPGLSLPVRAGHAPADGSRRGCPGGQGWTAGAAQNKRSVRPRSCRPPRRARAKRTIPSLARPVGRPARKEAAEGRRRAPCSWDAAAAPLR
uniref:WD repeat-containing protein 87 n=1 Tax=Salvator merianae TaxID=96440 RepID=A0A8D0AZV3_SALMN